MADAKRSQLLTEMIQQEILANKQISFAQFMDQVLYHPLLGYYNAHSFSLGKEGDYITAPEISPLFAKCFVKPTMQLFEHLGKGNILELGAGSGCFAKDLLQELQKRNALPTHYFIYDKSLTLRQKQQAFLKEHCRDLFHLFIWLEELPKNFTGTIIANEVLDALPVSCFQKRNGVISEKCITWQNDHFIWQNGLKKNEALLNALAQIEIPNDYQSEVCLALSHFIKEIVTSLTAGTILFIDYGYGELEYYHPERVNGTLTCFYQHRRHDNPLIFPGLQDITAHVNFTALAKAGLENECDLLGYTTQAAFLLANDLLKFAAAEKNPSPVDEVKLHQAVKLLTLPTEMGERMKVMALGKNVELQLSGFDWGDRRRDL